MLNEIKNTTLSRLKNPLISSYLISFFFINWKAFIFLLLSDKKIECKIHYIENNFSDGWMFFIPLIIAAFYSIVIPLTEVYIHRILKKPYFEYLFEFDKSNQIEELEAKIEFAKRERIIEDTKAGTSEINSLNQKNDVLQKEKSIIEKENIELRNELIVIKEKSKVDYLELQGSLTSLNNKIYFLDILLKTILKYNNDEFEFFKDFSLKIYGRKEIDKNKDIRFLFEDFGYDKCDLLLKSKFITKNKEGRGYLLTELGKFAVIYVHDNF